MFRSEKRFLSILVLTLWLNCLTATASQAAETSPVESAAFSADAAELYVRASKVTAPATADVIYLESQERVVFDADGKAVRTRYYLYRVLTEKGASGWANIMANWEPWREERPEMRARVITPDHEAHPLDVKTITDAPAKATDMNLFSDRRVSRAPLPAVAPGSLVEEEIVTRDTIPFFGGVSVLRFHVSRNVPMEHSFLTLTAPAALPIHYDLRLLPGMKPQRSERDGQVTLVFEHGHSDAVENVDSFLPSDVHAYASIGFSTGASWQRIAAGYSEVVDKQIAASDLRTLVAGIVAGQNSRDEKVFALLQYLDREVRYSGVEVQEAGIVPRTPDETLTRKYGDCKDKATLLVAMLRTAGIPAAVALVNAGDREDISAELPGLGAFDHAIVYVPGSPVLWIDATDEYARLGEVPLMDQGRQALIAQPGTTAPVPVPVLPAADNLTLEKREIILAENGPARVIETSEPHGSLESSYRRRYADKEDKKTREHLAEYMKAQYLAENLDRMSRSEPRDLSRQFQLVLESDRAKRGSTDLDSAAAAIRFEGLFMRLPAELRQREKEEKKGGKDKNEAAKKPREADYQLPGAYVTEWQYTIVPPAGFRPKPLPQQSTVAVGPGQLTQQYSADKDGVVYGTVRFEIPKRRISAEEGRTLRDKIVQQQEGPPVLILFEPTGQALLNEGRVSEALKSYHDVIAAHPKEAVQHLRLAHAFLSAGLGEAAREEARTAVKLEPSSALAERTLALILEYDSVGRKFRSGSDYAGAEAAFRSAIALDPEDKANIADLAVLLEFNRWGLRYGPGSRLKEAIEQYRKLTPEELTKVEMQNNLAFALFYDGQFAEARKNAEGLNPSPDALMVACETVLNGSVAGLTEARKRTGQEAGFKEIAGRAGLMLVNLRKYALGADLEEASESGDNASTTADFVSLYRKMTPYEQMKFNDDPAGVALRLEVLTSDPALTMEQMRVSISRNGATAMVTVDLLDAIRREAKNTIIRDAKEEDFPGVGIDLSLARARPTVQGDDRTGYKVILWPGASYKSARYVIKEDGHYRILATSEHLGGVGLEVLDRVKANDLAGARALLDWVREDIHAGGEDDPLAGPVYPHLWTRGRPADAAAIRIAAAALLVTGKETMAAAIPILEEALQTATSEPQKVFITTALNEAYLTNKDFAKVLPGLKFQATQYPESDSLFGETALTLASLSRYDEARALAESRLKSMPGDIAALRSLATTAEMSGDYGRARGAWQKVIEHGQAAPEDWNSAAWNALYTGSTGAVDLDNAIKAAQLTDKASGVLHTLGCVYAELGKTKESREVLVQAMDASNMDEPDDAFWYAFGRIAEQYGERDTAIADYNRVQKPKEALYLPLSSYRLAQMRLAAMGVGQQDKQ